MIDPITGPFDHPQQTPPAPMFSTKCDFCDAGILLDPNDPDQCDCECHEGLAVVTALEIRGELDAAIAKVLIDGIRKGQGYCESCRQSHSCVICGGTGEL